MARDTIKLEAIEFPYVFSHRVAASHGGGENKTLTAVARFYAEPGRHDLVFMVEDHGKVKLRTADLVAAIAAYNHL